MTYLLLFVIAFGLIVFQTAFLPYLAGPSSLYDLCVPLLIYLGLKRPLIEGILLALFCGWLMDGLGGGPMGVYLAGYVWMVMGVRGLASFLQANSLLLGLLIVPAGVMLQNIIVIGSAVLLQKAHFDFAWVVRGCTTQLILAAVSGPVLLSVINALVTRFEGWNKTRRLSNQM